MTKIRLKRFALSTELVLCRFHDGFLLWLFLTWEKRLRRNSLVSMKPFKTSPIRPCFVTFCSTTKTGQKRKTHKKMRIDSSKPVSQSHPQAKEKKVVELPRK